MPPGGGAFLRPGAYPPSVSMDQWAAGVEFIGWQSLNSILPQIGGRASLVGLDFVAATATLHERIL